MSVTPKDLLEYASRLVGADSEVEWRAATSRAYYGAYHSCVPIQARMGAASGSKRGTHAALIQDFQEYLGGETPDVRNKIRALGKLLYDLRHLRTTADYHVEEAYSATEAIQALELAKRIAERTTQVRKSRVT